MEALPRTIEIYQNEQGGKPYRQWLDQQPKEVQVIVDIRLKRVEKGLLGDHHAEGGDCPGRTHDIGGNRGGL